MLGHQRVHRWNTGDVEDRDGAARLHDPLQQRLHHHLRACRVQGADHRQGEDAVPQFHHRRRQLQHVLLLPHDDFLAGALVHLRGEQSQLIEQDGGGPLLGGDLRGGKVLAQAREERLLEREHEHRGLGGAVARLSPGPRHRGEQLLHVLPGSSVEGCQVAAGCPLTDSAQERGALLLELGLLDQLPAQRSPLLRDPLGEQRVLILANQLGQSGSHSPPEIPRPPWRTHAACYRRVI